MECCPDFFVCITFYISNKGKCQIYSITGKITVNKIGSAVIKIHVAETANYKAKTITVSWNRDKNASGYML